MKIDRQRVKDAFVEYTSNYDNSDGKIKLKIDHTYRVAAICEEIAHSLNLNKNDTDIAWLTGMLHDVGRFEQLKNYGTFSDADSIDHAKYGVQILFDMDKIADYVDIEQINANDCGKGELEMVRTAIWNHSAYRVEEGIDDKTKMFCDILRDADKIDIFKVNYDVPFEVIYNVTNEQLVNDEVTKEVMEAFCEHHAVLRSLKKTSVDHIVGHIALAYELVYPESYKIMKRQGYINRLLEFQSDNPKTRGQFEIINREMEDYIEKCL